VQLHCVLKCAERSHRRHLNLASKQLVLTLVVFRQLAAVPSASDGSERRLRRIGQAMPKAGELDKLSALRIRQMVRPPRTHLEPSYVFLQMKP
jgi:hypothetical protein